MKKILSLVLAIMMVLSMANVAFATPSDVTDKNQQKAVDALMSLGIVNGYEDGSYKPEKVVTRAELAKLLVEAKGQGSFAQGSESSFKDTKGQWYDGYVAMAAGLDLVNGYPDGTFKGDNSVSYQEAVVMLVRALGYTNQTVNNGVDSYNESKYKALAASLVLLKNVTFKNSGANRGDIASMIYNALDVETVKTVDGKAEKVVAYTESETDPITGKTKTVNVYALFIDNVATAKELVIAPANIDPNSAEYLGKNVDLVPYMYQNVRAYFNENDELLSVKKVLSSVVVGNNNSYRTDDVRHAWGTLQFKTADGSTKKVFTNYDGVAANDYNITVYLNGEETTIKASTLHSTYRTSKSTYVLDKNNIVINAIIEAATYTARVSEAYRLKDVTIKGQNDNKATVTIYLPKNAAAVDLTKVTVTGAVDSIEDIAKGDIVTAYASAGKTGGAPTLLKLAVSRETVEGVITEHYPDYSATINGKTYLYANTVVARNVNAGSEGVFYLTAAGTIFSFDGKSINNNEYALIVDSGDGYAPSTQIIAKAFISIFDKNSKVTKYNFSSDAIYSLDGSTKVTVWDTTGYAKQNLITVLENANANNDVLVTGFNLNSNGDISEIELKTLVPKANVKVDSKTFILSNDVVIYNTYMSGTELKYFVMNADKLKDDTTGYFIDTNKDGEICAIVYTKLVNLPDYMILTDVYNIYNNGKVVQKVHGLVNGQEVTYLTNSSTVIDESVCWDTLLKLTINASGEITLANQDDRENVADLVDTSFNRTTTSGSAISIINVANGAFKYNNTAHSLADNGAIYVLNRTSRNFFDTAVTGSISELSRTDVDVYMYDLDPSTEGYEVILVVQRPLTK